MSTSSTRRPYSARAAPRLIVDVVFPTPPFWLHIATTLAGPCEERGLGSGIARGGRPVRPTSEPLSASSVMPGCGSAAWIASACAAVGKWGESQESLTGRGDRAVRPPHDETPHVRATLVVW